MITDAINSVLGKLFICNIGYVINYILKVASPHLNYIRWSKTAIYIFDRGAFLQLCVWTSFQNPAQSLCFSLLAIASAFINSPFLLHSLRASLNLALDKVMSSNTSTKLLPQPTVPLHSSDAIFTHALNILKNLPTQLLFVHFLNILHPYGTPTPRHS